MSRRREVRRPSLRYGLPYGWWKSTDVWAVSLCLLIIVGMFGGIVLAWFFDWKPVW